MQNLAQMVEPDAFADRLLELAENGQRFLRIRARLGRVALRQVDARQHRQTRRDLARIVEAAPYLDAFAKHRLGFHVVALIGRQHAAHVESERPRDIGLLNRRQRQRGAHVVAALGRIAAKGSEAHKRDSSLTAMTGSTPPASANAMAARRLSSSISIRRVHSA